MYIYRLSLVIVAMYVVLAPVRPTILTCSPGAIVQKNLSSAGGSEDPA